MYAHDLVNFLRQFEEDGLIFIFGLFEEHPVMLLATFNILLWMSVEVLLNEVAIIGVLDLGEEIYDGVVVLLGVLLEVGRGDEEAETLVREVDEVMVRRPSLDVLAGFEVLEVHGLRRLAKERPVRRDIDTLKHCVPLALDKAPRSSGRYG